MTHRHAVVVVCVVVAVLLSPTVLAQETATPTANATDESDTAGMGTQITAFLQSSSAAANDSVENGMWNARFDQANASQRARLVTNRTGQLERRLTQLQARNETIQERYANGSLPRTAYVAQQSQLGARIDALQAAVNDTDTAATEAGVDDSRLESLRRNASELTGPEVAGVARGLGGGPPTDRGGPPERAGPPTNQTGPGGQGPPTNQTGPGGQGPPTNQTTDSAANGASQPGNGDSGNATSDGGTADGQRGDGSQSGGNSGGSDGGNAGGGNSGGSNGGNAGGGNSGGSNGGNAGGGGNGGNAGGQRGT